MYLTWDLKFLFLVEAGDQFLGRLKHLAHHLCHCRVSSVTSHITLRGERAASRVLNRSKAGRLMPVVAPEEGRLAPGIARMMLSCRTVCNANGLAPRVSVCHPSDKLQSLHHSLQLLHI
ncbi:hypothetical protein HAX54_037261 [Datura stramonium]|uniref:Uncharacterized protein n=1 Tax=Datura stramonium TaxID=4076 RepID=A0ABS8VJT6_DATST|nr:hypothetical protein [Datura stramonium]